MTLKVLFASALALMSPVQFPVSKPPQRIELTPRNSLVLRGEITDDNIANVQYKLYRLSIARKTNTPIYLVLDSPGGSLDAGNVFIAYAKTVPNLHTITLFAASMAAAIVEAVPGQRYMTESGILMFHRASGGIGGQVEMGEMESRLLFLKATVLLMERSNAARIGIDLADYKARVKDEWWMVGADAVLSNASDSLVEIECSKDLIDQVLTITSRGLFSTTELSYSNCPLFRYPLTTPKESK